MSVFAFFRRITLGASVLLAFVHPAFGSDGASLSFSELEAPLPPRSAYFLANSGSAILLAGGYRTDDGEGALSADVFAWEPGASEWMKVGALPEPRADGTAATVGGATWLIGGVTANGASADVMVVRYAGGTVSFEPRTPLREPLVRAAAAALGKKLYVAGGARGADLSEASDGFRVLDVGIGSSRWRELEPWPDGPRHSASLVASVERVFLFGGIRDGEPLRDGFSWHSLYGWRPIAPPPFWGADSEVSSMGEAHAALFGSPPAQSSAPASIFAYHTITDTWLAIADWPGPVPSRPRLVVTGDGLTVLSPDGSSRLAIEAPPTNYGWWDHLAVIVYFMGMIYIGFHFTRQRKNTQDYFRGGNRIPWWATGMSLFATGASAISLLAMPGKAFSSNWTYFAISIYSVLCLPLSMYVLAPLVRKLNVSTAFEYLELRFGLAARMLGSIIFIVTQVLGRMGPVMLLPSIAMAAITGIDITVCILAMGITTTLYTYLGGLAAVIWTDTIQGFVMIAAVAGCLLLVYLKIEMEPEQIWASLASADKLHVFDWGWDVTQPLAAMVFIGIAMITLFSIGDQNYVQRVQCTPTLKDAKKAIATQMGVAVPINLLLFGLGTALYLYYQENPSQLNPQMKTDGIFPFFAAQQLPPGVSGLVVAALLAATMSTISSSICSVANLGVDDFYRRFKPSASENSAVLLGRALTAVVGVVGIGAALFLAKSNMPSVWDLALLVINLVSNGIVGLFALGLLTRRANQTGAIAGVCSGMIAVFLLQRHTEITFWIYAFIGSLVTFGVGYVVSLMTSARERNLDGLTVYTLNLKRSGQ